MAGINNETSYREDTLYNLLVNRNRTLNFTKKCVFFSATTTGFTEFNFDFSIYTGATMEVRRTFGSTVLLTFSTLDGSIILGANGEFSLVKSADDLKTLRAGEYQYDIYLSSNSKPKRAFLYGKFTLYDYITE